MDYLKEKHPKVLDDHEFLEELLEKINQWFNNWTSSNDWNDICTRNSYEDLEGHIQVSWNRYGFCTFLEILLNTYNNGPGLPSLDIKLNKNVILIKWAQNSTGDVEVICKDGDRYTADNVIVTVSLEVLKERYGTLFSPMLPKEKIIAIKTISVGFIGKIILSFSERWWNDETEFLFFWTKSDKEKLSKDCKWLLNVGISTIPEGSDNTITLWTSGEISKIVETLPEDKVMSMSTDLLQRFLDGKYNVPQPTGIIRSTWYSNPFIKCAYTFDGFQQHPNARNILAEPLLDKSGNPKVLFAGEATDYTRYSTVDGAYKSGHREALRLLSC